MPSQNSSASSFDVTPSTGVTRVDVADANEPAAASDPPIHSDIVELKPVIRVEISLPYADARRQAIHEFERIYVEALLARSHGNVSQAAREAKIDRVYLHRLIRRHRPRRGA